MLVFNSCNDFWLTWHSRNRYGLSVRAQRRPWLLTATLMLASAAAAAWSTYLHWLPCQGRMLRGTIIQPYADDGPSYEEFAKLDPAVKARMFACEARMAGDQGRGSLS
jgi:hypothetical protein